MASDPTAGGAPAEMPAEGTEQNPDVTPEALDLEQRVEQLQAENADLQDKYMRAAAETQNMRRRAQQDVEKERKFGIERFARDVLSVADNLGRALSVMPAEPADAAQRNLLEGVKATQRELQSVLERHGVTRIESLGKPFDAQLHQAMMEIEDRSVPAGTIVQELVPGYLIAGRLLRAAMVALAKGGPQPSREASDESASNDA